MNRVLNFLSGALLGAMVGVVVVLLLAPRSGAETQQLIQNRVQAVLDEGRQAAEARRFELTEQFEALKQKA
jgi:gas vesicle protein